MIRNEAGRVLAVMAAAYRTELADDNAEVWYGSALQDITLELGLQAAERIIKSDQWFPTPARFNEVRRSIEAAAEPAAKSLPRGPRTESEKDAARRYITMSRELLAKWKSTNVR